MAKQVKSNPRQSPGKFLQILSPSKAQAQAKSKSCQSPGPGKLSPSPGKAQAQKKPKPRKSSSTDKAQAQEQNNNFCSKIKISPPFDCLQPIFGPKNFTQRYVLVTSTRIYLSLTVMAFSLTVLLAERSVGCSSYRRQYKNVQGSYR